MKKLARWLTAVSLFGGGVLVLGNRQDPWLWAYAATFSLLTGVALAGIDEDLAKERFHPPSPGADRLSLRTVRIVALAHLIIGVLDSRYGWTSVPGWLRGAGLAGFAAAFALVIWAMRTNRYFSAVVRVQDDRGHRVVDSGPYSIVRHPGYAGMIPFAPLSGLALGSWISAAVALVYSALILKRVLFEDRFLADNLTGYRGYAGRVRYRLVPGIW